MTLVSYKSTLNVEDEPVYRSKLNVDPAIAPNNGEVLTYDTVSGEWKSQPAPAPSGTANGVAYFDGGGALTADPTLFSFDGTNAGIGVSTPTAKLHVVGVDATAANFGFKVQDSTLADLFAIYNSGQIKAGNDTVGLLMGSNSGLNVSGSLYSTAFGVNALQSMVTGNYNSAFGMGALASLNGGDRNCAFGFGASANTIGGFGNATFGWGAGSTSNASFVSAFGFGALQSNTNGSNTAVGGNASSNSTGSDLTIVGFQAGDFGTTGDGNSYFGINAHRRNVTGQFNCVFGAYAGEFNVSNSSNNVFMGYESGYFNNDTGDGTGTVAKSNNTFIGMQTGFQSTGSNSVYLGFRAGFFETADNKLFIDNDQRANEADARLKSLLYGIFDAATANQYLAINAQKIALAYLPTGNAGVASGELYVDTAANILGNVDLVVARKV